MQIILFKFAGDESGEIVWFINTSILTGETHPLYNTGDWNHYHKYVGIGAITWGVFRKCFLVRSLMEQLLNFHLWIKIHVFQCMGRCFYLPKFQDIVRLKFWKCWTNEHFQTSGEFLYILMWIWYAFGTPEDKMSCDKIWPAKTLMGKIFCVEFQRVPMKFHTKYLTHTLKDMILYNIEILRAVGFKTSSTFCIYPQVPETHFTNDFFHQNLN